MTLWLSFRSGIGFLSTIPVGISMEGIDALMKKLYFYPIVGSFMGILMAVCALIAEMFFPSPLTILLIMGSIYCLTWFNHLDGVADMGDGMTAHGSLEKKRKALKDMNLGVGGAASVALALIGLFAALSALENAAGGFAALFGSAADAAASLGFSENAACLLFGLLTSVGVSVPAVTALSVILAELAAKQAMLTTAAFGKSFHDGLGAMTINGATKKNFIIGFTYGLIVSAVLMGAAGVLAYLAACAAALYVLHVSNRHFEGLNGDGIGTSNEAGRITAYAALAVIFFTITQGGFIWTLL